MKHNYRKLKFTILLQTLLVFVVTILVGGGVLYFVVNRVASGSFAEWFVDVLMSFGLAEERAISLYWSLIGNNKLFFLIVGFVLLFALFFYVSLSQMTRYLDQVGDGIENIVSDSDEPIHLVTELKPLEIRLNEIKATLRRQEIEAEEEEQKKNDLVVFLAHDLKTPLTSIVAYLTMLDGYPEMEEEERQKYVQIALDKSVRLGELINEFFDITRYNLQDIELNCVDVDLTLLLEQLVDEFYGILKEHQLNCEVDAPESLEINGDPDRLARVFDNILRNAIAYCHEGTTITITAREQRGSVEIIFSDEGDKIPGEMLQTIFEKFYRVDNSRSSDTGGAGLGLAIAKEIVELHHGTIQARSDDMKTQFIVTLPAKEGQEEEIEEGVKDEVHTHRRLAFRGKSGTKKRASRKADKGDLEQPGAVNETMQG